MLPWPKLYTEFKVLLSQNRGYSSRSRNNVFLPWTVCHQVRAYTVCKDCKCQYYICGTSFSELWNFYFRLPLLIRKGLNRWIMQHDQYLRHTLPTVPSAHTSHKQKVVTTLPTLLILEERQWNLVPHKLLFLHISTPVLSMYLTVNFSLCQPGQKRKTACKVCFLHRQKSAVGLMTKYLEYSCPATNRKISC